MVLFCSESQGTKIVIDWHLVCKLITLGKGSKFGKKSVSQSQIPEESASKHKASLLGVKKTAMEPRPASVMVEEVSMHIDYVMHYTYVRKLE